MSKNKTAIVVGHDKNSPGAYSSHLRASEYIYNSEVASYLSDVADIYYRPLVGGYNTQMSKLAEELNPKNYDLVIELHFNAFNKKANGCEVVIFPNNNKAKEWGNKFNKEITDTYGTKNRGVKEHGKGDRGYGFLSKMKATAIIVEPFFGDNEEALNFTNHKKYADIIRKLI